jgi:hypothetical protein
VAHLQSGLIIGILIGSLTPHSAAWCETPVSTSVPPFKVESLVDRGDEANPISLSTTIFSEAKAFDFLKDPREVTIIDWRGNRVILLNPCHREEAELSFDAILRLHERVQSRARQERDPRQRFAADPDFAIQFDQAKDTLLLTSPWLTYRITTRSDIDPAIIREFLRFSDLMARVNCLLVQGSRLPNPRLKVNQALAERNLFPVEVRLIAAPRNFLEWLPGRQSVVRSTHTLVVGLTEEDRAQIDQAEKWTHEFRRVNFIDYQAKLAGN